MPSPAVTRNLRFALIGLGVLAVIGLLVWLGMRGGSAPVEQAPKAAEPMEFSKSQEVLLGVKAAPALTSQYGGEVNSGDQAALVDRVGKAIVERSKHAQVGWDYGFHLLAEPTILNAFALPGGQVYITTGLLNHLKTEGELAGVLAHQIAHVVKSHAAHTLAKGLTKEAYAAGGDTLDQSMASQLVAMRYATTEEAEADALAVQLMGDAGYDPQALVNVIRILATAYYAGAQVEYFTTHPNTADRVEVIEGVIKGLYPAGVPAKLSK